MPGLLHHFYFADKAFKNIANEMIKRGHYDCVTQDGLIFKRDYRIDYMSFLKGNIIPDLGKDKMASHFKVDSKIDRNFKVPDLPWARVQIQKLQGDSESDDLGVLFGLYAHLYLDRYFIETYLMPSFDWHFDTDRVVNPRNSLEWTISNFFSKCNGLYKGYDEINEKMVMNHSLDRIPIEDIPSELPKTGFSGFDKRKEDRNWKKDYHTYIAKGQAYTGEIFRYEDFVRCLEAAAKDFAQVIVSDGVL